MARTGWSLKEASVVLDIHERRVTQALDPALTKLAKLWRVNPTRTLHALLDAVEQLGPMTPGELDLLVRMSEGRVDREEIGLGPYPTARR